MTPSTTPNYLAQQGLALQLASLSNPVNCTPGVYVFQDENHSMALQGIVFAPHTGPYAGGVFRFLVNLSDGSPSFVSSQGAEVPPVIEFKQGLPTHPLIHPANRTLNLAPRFPRWQPRKHTIAHLLEYIRRVLQTEFLEEEVATHEGWWTNAEVGKLLRTSPNLFRKLATQSVALSNTRSVLHNTDKEGGNPGEDSKVDGRALRPCFPLPELSDVELKDNAQKIRQEIFGTDPMSEDADVGASSGESTDGSFMNGSS